MNDGDETMPPVEGARGVFLLLLDAYREARDYHLRNLYGVHAPALDELIDQRRQQIKADCEGWRVRYEAAVARAAVAQQREARP